MQLDQQLDEFLQQAGQAFEDTARALFTLMILPTMRKMPTDELRRVQTIVNEEIGKELASREVVDVNANGV